MAATQAMIYAPQCGDITMESVLFQYPNPPIDSSEACPLNEFIIKFTVKNGKNPSTIDYKTFCKSTGLDYNKRNYVAYPSLEVVKAELDRLQQMRHWFQRPQY
ncbi:hypothetical protein Tco_0931610 [Tanacetum coccineum]